MTNLGPLGQVIAGILLFALTALVVTMVIHWLRPPKVNLPLAEPVMAWEGNALQKNASHDPEAVAERPPGLQLEAGTIAAEVTLPLLVGDAKIANLYTEKPDLVAVHRPEETNRSLEALMEANKQRAEEAREKAENSRLAVIAGTLSEEAVAVDFGYSNVRGMRRAWKRYNA